MSILDNLFKIQKDKDLTIDYNRFGNQLSTITEISEAIVGITNVDELLGVILSKLVTDWDLKFPSIYLKDNLGNLNIKVFNAPPVVVNNVKKVLGGDISKIFKLKISQEYNNNILVRSMLLEQVQTTNNFYEFVVPLVSQNVADFIQKIMNMHTMLAIPLQVRDKTIGVIAISSPYKEISDIDMKGINTVVNQISVAISNANLFTEIQTQVDLLTAKNKDLSSLYNLTSQVNKTLDPKAVLQSAVDSLPQDENMIGGAISIYEKDTGRVYVSTTTQNSVAYQAQKAIGDFSQYSLNVNDTNPKVQQNITLRAIREGQPQFSNNLSDYMEPVVPKNLLNLVAPIINIRTIAVYPLYSKGQILGVATYFFRQKEVKDITDAEKQLFSTYTNQIAIALENAQLYRITTETQLSLEKSLKDLEAARQHERDMIDIMGHELRTPMSIVRNAIVMLDMQSKTLPQEVQTKLKKYIDIGIESARREVTLIETLLSATKTDGKGFQLLLEKIDLKDVINDSLTAFKREAERKGLSLIYEPPPTSIFVYADRTRIQEISDNFISNAVKYTLKGSVVISITTDTDFAYISVKDTGMGISEEDLKRLGQKFFRARQYSEEEELANPETDEKNHNVVRPGGTGLGLYVTFNLIKILDGKLDIKSKLKEGSTFTFGMPIYKNQPTTQVEKTTEAQ